MPRKFSLLTGACICKLHEEIYEPISLFVNPAEGSGKVPVKASPGILFRVLEKLGDQSKILAHLQPQVRLRHPAVVCVNGVILGQLSGNQPAVEGKKGGF